ncbi:MAG: hypothetical protein ACI9JR_000670 [Gammaproteobacteria bacterium]|jgi:hypothetical protein
MRMKFYLLLSALLIWIPSWPATAVVVDDLYTIELPVADQTTSHRLEAFSEAFQQVLTKVSGSDEAQESSAISRLTPGSSRYVKQFSYVNRPGVDAEGAAQNFMYLKIDFDQQQIEQILRNHSFPVWGRERPSILLVINSQAGGKIQLVSGDATPEIVSMLDTAALNRGVPTLLPLMDLEDIGLISVADVTSRRFDTIGNMAVRYGPDALVVGEIVEQSAESWRGAWEVRFAEQIFKWKFQAETSQAVIDELVMHLASVLALEYALEDHQRNEQDLLLQVSSMSDLSRLISVQKYLESLNAVESAHVSFISGSDVTFRLKLRNSTEDLQRLIEFGNVLEQQGFPQINAQTQGGAIINYNYVGRGASN